MNVTLFETHDTFAHFVPPFQVMLGDVESERDSYVEKLSDYEKVRERLSELEERDSQLIKNIEDLKTQQTFIQVQVHSCLHLRNSTERENYESKIILK